jgi:hypothetical protein
MDANGNLTVNSDDTVTEYFVLGEVINWDGAEEYRPRNLSGIFATREAAEKVIAERDEAESYRPAPMWRNRVVVRTSRKVVEWTE